MGTTDHENQGNAVIVHTNVPVRKCMRCSGELRFVQSFREHYCTRCAITYSFPEFRDRGTNVVITKRVLPSKKGAIIPITKKTEELKIILRSQVKS